MAGRSPVSQSSRRCHRQPPPCRGLHRQVVLAGWPNGTAGPSRVSLLRDAATCAHKLGAAVAPARLDRLVLARAAARLAGALGHRPARPIHAGALGLGGLSRRAGGSSRRRLRFRAGLVSCPTRVSLSILWRRYLWRPELGVASRSGALASS